MEFMIDYDIIGEILIPLKEAEIGKAKDEHPQTTKTKFSDLVQTTYANYRSVLLQGEIVKFYVMLKCSQKDVPRAKEMFENFYFQIEFESTQIQKSKEQSKGKGQEIELNKEEYEKTLSDLFTTNSDKLRNQNPECENIISKEFDEESQTMVYEVYKQIIAPQNFLNVNLIMKLKLMTKNEISYEEDINVLNYYQNGYYNTVETYKLLKTIYKEIKIIKAIEINEVKQIDVLIDMSLLQAKIENTTAQVNLIDSSLIYSKFIQNVPKGEEKIIKNGLTININEIQILKDETTLDEAQTSNVSKIKDLYIKQGKVSLSNINFSIYNTEFPVKIKPGEEYYFTLKVLKSAFLNEKTDNKPKDDNIIPRNAIGNNNNDSAMEETISESSPSFVEGLIRRASRTLSMSSNREVTNAFRKPSIFMPNATLSNITPLRYDFSNFGNQKNIYRNSNKSKGTLTDNGNAKTNEEENYENFKISFITPIILCISSEIFSDNLFMCIQIKWNNEINRFLKVEINTPESVYLHEYFEVSLKCRNISSSEMNLYIEIADSFGDMKNNEGIIFDYQAKNVEVIPCIISQTKFQNFGMFNCNEDKVFVLKFLPLKIGFATLPNFSIIDSVTGKRYYIIHSNKIFIKER